MLRCQKLNGRRLNSNRHVTALTEYLTKAALVALARIARELGTLPDLRMTVDELVTEIRAGRRKGSAHKAIVW